MKAGEIAAAEKDAHEPVRPIAPSAVRPRGRARNAPARGRRACGRSVDGATGVNAAIAALTVAVVVATACAVVSVVALTARLKVLDDVCTVGVVWSVTVTVNVVADNRVVGVPVIWPVVVENESSIGKVPPDSA